MSFAQAPDGALLEWEGAGAGEPMLLITGQGVSRRHWDPIAPHLASTFRVLTYDGRGIGASTIGDAPVWSTRALVADAVAVLDAAGVDRAHIVGHSMGGRIAQWLAIDHPGRVATLTLLSSTGGDARGPARTAEATAALAAGDPERLGPYFFGTAFRAAHPEAVALLGRASVPLGVRRGHFQASSTHDAWDELGRITAPALVVHGADDAITLAAHGRAVADAVVGAAYLEVPGGHAVHLEDPAVVEAIVAFAGAHPVSPR